MWWFELDRETAELARLARTLSADEHARVARLRFPLDGQRALAARGLLRELLGRYVGRAPRELQFEYGPQNKPDLAGQPVHFNLSHSGGFGVCAIMLDRPVGVDVEHVRLDFDHDGIAEHSFSAAERAVLAHASAEDSARDFFRCWTLKEAYIKARGGGLSIPLDTFDVPLTGGRCPRPVVSRETLAAAHGWLVRELETDRGLAAAVAAPAPAWNVREWRLT